MQNASEERKKDGKLEEYTSFLTFMREVGENDPRPAICTFCVVFAIVALVKFDNFLFALLCLNACVYAFSARNKLIGGSRDPAHPRLYTLSGYSHIILMLCILIFLGGSETGNLER